MWITNHLLSGMHVQVSDIICHQATLLLLPCFAIGFLHRLSFFFQSLELFRRNPQAIGKSLYNWAN